MTARTSFPRPECDVFRRRRAEKIPGPDGAEVGVGLLSLVSSVVVPSLPSSAYVPAGLGLAGAGLALGAGAGCSADDLGLSSSRVRDGLKLGGVTAAAMTLAVVAAAAVPAGRRLFSDERQSDQSGVAAAYHLLVRIPIGTAVAEELMFRGAVFGVFRRRRAPLAAAIISSALFGLWHVVPALGAQDELASSVSDVAGTVGLSLATVAATAAAGMGFAYLRVRSDSVVAPIVAHAALNATAFGISVIVS